MRLKGSKPSSCLKLINLLSTRTWTELHPTCQFPVRAATQLRNKSHFFREWSTLSVRNWLKDLASSQSDPTMARASALPKHLNVSIVLGLRLTTKTRIRCFSPSTCVQIKVPLTPRTNLSIIETMSLISAQWSERMRTILTRHLSTTQPSRQSLWKMWFEASECSC